MSTLIPPNQKTPSKESALSGISAVVNTNNNNNPNNSTTNPNTITNIQNAPRHLRKKNSTGNTGPGINNSQSGPGPPNLMANPSGSAGLSRVQNGANNGGVPGGVPGPASPRRSSVYSTPLTSFGPSTGSSGLPGNFHGVHHPRLSQVQHHQQQVAQAAQQHAAQQQQQQQAQQQQAQQQQADYIEQVQQRNSSRNLLLTVNQNTNQQGGSGPGQGQKQSPGHSTNNSFNPEPQRDNSGSGDSGNQQNNSNQQQGTVSVGQPGQPGGPQSNSNNQPNNANTASGGAPGPGLQYDRTSRNQQSTASAFNPMPQQTQGQNSKENGQNTSRVSGKNDVSINPLAGGYRGGGGIPSNFGVGSSLVGKISSFQSNLRSQQQNNTLQSGSGQSNQGSSQQGQNQQQNILSTSFVNSSISGTVQEENLSGPGVGQGGPSPITHVESLSAPNALTASRRKTVMTQGAGFTNCNAHGQNSQALQNQQQSLQNQSQSLLMNQQQQYQSMQIQSTLTGAQIQQTGSFNANTNPQQFGGGNNNNMPMNHMFTNGSTMNGGNLNSMNGNGDYVINQDSQVSLGIHNNDTLINPPPEAENWGARGLMFSIMVSVILGTIIGLVGAFFHNVVHQTKYLVRVVLGGAVMRAVLMDNETDESTVASDYSGGEGSVLNTNRDDSYDYIIYLHMWISATLTTFFVSFVSRHFCPECIGGGMVATKICICLAAPIQAQIILYRFVLSSVYIGGGSPLGIEAPTFHLCAALASSMNGFVEKLDASILNPDTLPQIVLIGCVAGLSQAFNTPIGSLLFVLEEFDFVRRSHVTFVMIVACSVPATAVSLYFKETFGLHASFLALPAPEGLASKSISITFTYVSAIIIGLVSGTFAEIFAWFVLILREKFTNFIQSFDDTDNDLGDEHESADDGEMNVNGTQMETEEDEQEEDLENNSREQLNLEGNSDEEQQYYNEQAAIHGHNNNRTNRLSQATSINSSQSMPDSNVGNIDPNDSGHAGSASDSEGQQLQGEQNDSGTGPQGTNNFDNTNSLASNQTTVNPRPSGFIAFLPARLQSVIASLSFVNNDMKKNKNQNLQNKNRVQNLNKVNNAREVRLNNQNTRPDLSDNDNDDVSNQGSNANQNSNPKVVPQHEKVLQEKVLQPGQQQQYNNNNNNNSNNYSNQRPQRPSISSLSSNIWNNDPRERESTNTNATLMSLRDANLFGGPSGGNTPGNRFNLFSNRNFGANGSGGGGLGGDRGPFRKTMSFNYGSSPKDGSDSVGKRTSFTQKFGTFRQSINFVDKKLSTAAGKLINKIAKQIAPNSYDSNWSINSQQGEGPGGNMNKKNNKFDYSNGILAMTSQRSINTVTYLFNTIPLPFHIPRIKLLIRNKEKGYFLLSLLAGSLVGLTGVAVSMVARHWASIDCAPYEKYCPDAWGTGESLLEYLHEKLRTRKFLEDEILIPGYGIPSSSWDVSKDIGIKDNKVLDRRGTVFTAKYLRNAINSFENQKLKSWDYYLQGTSELGSVDWNHWCGLNDYVLSNQSSSLRLREMSLSESNQRTKKSILRERLFGLKEHQENQEFLIDSENKNLISGDTTLDANKPEPIIQPQKRRRSLNPDNPDSPIELITHEEAERRQRRERELIRKQIQQYDKKIDQSGSGGSSYMMKIGYRLFSAVRFMLTGDNYRYRRLIESSNEINFDKDSEDKNLKTQQASDSVNTSDGKKNNEVQLESKYKSRSDQTANTNSRPIIQSQNQPQNQRRTQSSQTSYRQSPSQTTAQTSNSLNQQPQSPTQPRRRLATKATYKDFGTISNWHLMLTYVTVGVLKIFIVAICTSAGGPGGMFAPAMIIGGYFGGFMGSVMRIILSETALFQDQDTLNEDLGTYHQLSVLFGMVGFFSSSHRLPLTGALCIYELIVASMDTYSNVAGSHVVLKLFFPMLVCSIISFSLGIFINPQSLLERTMEQDGLHDVCFGGLHDFHDDYGYDQMYADEYGGYVDQSMQMQQQGGMNPMDQQQIQQSLQQQQQLYYNSTAMQQQLGGGNTNSESEGGGDNDGDSKSQGSETGAGNKGGRDTVHGRDTYGGASIIWLTSQQSNLIQLQQQGRQSTMSNAVNDYGFQQQGSHLNQSQQAALIASRQSTAIAQQQQQQQTGPGSMVGSEMNNPPASGIFQVSAYGSETAQNKYRGGVPRSSTTTGTGVSQMLPLTNQAVKASNSGVGRLVVSKVLLPNNARRTQSVDLGVISRTQVKKMMQEIKEYESIDQGGPGDTKDGGTQTGRITSNVSEKDNIDHLTITQKTFGSQDNLSATGTGTKKSQKSGDQNAGESGAPNMVPTSIQGQRSDGDLNSSSGPTEKAAVTVTATSDTKNTTNLNQNQNLPNLLKDTAQGSPSVDKAGQQSSRPVSASSGTAMTNKDQQQATGTGQSYNYARRSSCPALPGLNKTQDEVDQQTVSITKGSQAILDYYVSNTDIIRKELEELKLQNTQIQVPPGPASNVSESGNVQGTNARPSFSPGGLQPTPIGTHSRPSQNTEIHSLGQNTLTNQQQQQNQQQQYQQQHGGYLSSALHNVMGHQGVSTPPTQQTPYQLQQDFRDRDNPLCAQLGNKDRKWSRLSQQNTLVAQLAVREAQAQAQAQAQKSRGQNYGGTGECPGDQQRDLGSPGSQGSRGGGGPQQGVNEVSNMNLPGQTVNQTNQTMTSSGQQQQQQGQQIQYQNTGIGSGLQTDASSIGGSHLIARDFSLHSTGGVYGNFVNPNGPLMQSHSMQQSQVQQLQQNLNNMGNLNNLNQISNIQGSPSINSAAMLSSMMAGQMANLGNNNMNQNNNNLNLQSPGSMISQGIGQQQGQQQHRDLISSDRSQIDTASAAATSRTVQVTINEPLQPSHSGRGPEGMITKSNRTSNFNNFFAAFTNSSFLNRGGDKKKDKNKDKQQQLGQQKESNIMENNNNLNNNINQIQNLSQVMPGDDTNNQNQQLSNNLNDGVERSDSVVLLGDNLSNLVNTTNNRNSTLANLPGPPPSFNSNNQNPPGPRSSQMMVTKMASTPASYDRFYGNSNFGGGSGNPTATAHLASMNINLRGEDQDKVAPLGLGRDPWSNMTKNGGRRAGGGGGPGGNSINQGSGLNSNMNSMFNSLNQNDDADDNDDIVSQAASNFTTATASNINRMKKQRPSKAPTSATLRILENAMKRRTAASDTASSVGNNSLQGGAGGSLSGGGPGSVGSSVGGGGGGNNTNIVPGLAPGLGMGDVGQLQKVARPRSGSISLGSGGAGGGAVVNNLNQQLQNMTNNMNNRGENLNNNFQSNQNNMNFQNQMNNNNNGPVPSASLVINSGFNPNMLPPGALALAREQMNNFQQSQQLHQSIRE